MFQRIQVLRRFRTVWLEWAAAARAVGAIWGGLGAILSASGGVLGCPRGCFGVEDGRSAVFGGVECMLRGCWNGLGAMFDDIGGSKTVPEWV